VAPGDIAGPARRGDAGEGPARRSMRPLWARRLPAALVQSVEPAARWAAVWEGWQGFTVRASVVINDRD